MASTMQTQGQVPGERPGAGAQEPVVHSVTTARTSIAEDRAMRNRNYLIQMGIRTVCFVLACIIPGPLRWVFAAGAVFLPYVAVIFANAVNVHPEGEVEPAHGGALAGGPAGPLALGDEPDDDLLRGAPTDLGDHPDIHEGEVLSSYHHDERHEPGAETGSSDRAGSTA